MRIKVAVAVMRSKRPRGGGGVKRVIAAKDGTRRNDVALLTSE